MSEINYFQMYSQKENHATNNTLLILRHIYQESPRKLERILKDVTDEGLDIVSIGPVFKQQVKHSRSIPDGSIMQQPLKIFFEVKRGGGIDKKQIKNHIDSIKESDASSSTKILFALTKEKLPDDTIDELKALAKGNSIIFSAITFSNIIEALRENCASHETNLNEIIEDYENYLRSEDLLEPIGEWMFVVPVGVSMDGNKEFRLYYEPAHRKSRAGFKFLGLYMKKCVRYIGRVATVVTGHLDATKDKFKVESVEFPKNINYKPTNEELQRVTEAIDACSSYHPDVKENHRFYLFDELKETMWHKTSPSGLQRARPFNLSQWFEYSKDKKEYSTVEVAERLRNEEF